jgi:hypothetical protein
VRTCDARYGDVTCDRAPGHTGMHCGSVTAKWRDGEVPPDDSAELRAIVRELLPFAQFYADRNPPYRSHLDGSTQDPSGVHALLIRAREYVAKGGAEG